MALDAGWPRAIIVARDASVTTAQLTCSRAWLTRRLALLAARSIRRYVSTDARLREPSRTRYGVGGIQGVPVTGVFGAPVGSRPSGTIIVSVQISQDEWKPAGSPSLYGEGLVPNG